MTIEQRKRERRTHATRRQTYDRRTTRQLKSMLDLFHCLWGEARDGIYIKSDWIKMQEYLEKGK